MKYALFVAAFVLSLHAQSIDYQQPLTSKPGYLKVTAGRVNCTITPLEAPAKTLTVACVINNSPLQTYTLKANRAMSYTITHQFADTSTAKPDSVTIILASDIYSYVRWQATATLASGKTLTWEGSL